MIRHLKRFKTILLICVTHFTQFTKYRVFHSRNIESSLDFFSMLSTL